MPDNDDTTPALDAQSGDAEQAGGLTDDERDDLADLLMGKGYTHRSRYQVADWVLELGYRRITTAGGPDDGTAERALTEAERRLRAILLPGYLDNAVTNVFREVRREVRAAADTGHPAHILMEFGCEEHDCTPERFPEHYVTR